MFESPRRANALTCPEAINCDVNYKTENKTNFLDPNSKIFTRCFQAATGKERERLSWGKDTREYRPSSTESETENATKAGSTESETEKETGNKASGTKSETENKASSTKSETENKASSKKSETENKASSTKSETENKTKEGSTLNRFFKFHYLC